MKILYVCPDFPYPPTHGGRVDTWNRIRCLSLMGHNIDLVSTVKEKPGDKDLEVVQEIVDNVIIANRSYKLINFISSDPFQVASRDSLREITFSSNDFDLLFLDCEYVYRILFNPNLRSTTVLMRLQNNEEKYFRELAASTSNIFRKLYYLSDALKFRSVIHKIKRKVDGFLFISTEELLKMQEKYPCMKCYYLPPSLSLREDDFKELTSSEGGVLFIGSLFMPNNQEALSWYLTKVHPLITDQSYHLIIAGNSKETSIEWLYELIGSENNVEVYNSPRDLSPLYERSILFINPMRSGAGVKMKTIEAILQGLPVVSTSIGVEGTGFINNEHVIVRDVPDKFASIIEELLKDVRKRIELVKKSQKYVLCHYNQEEALNRVFSDFGIYQTRQDND